MNGRAKPETQKQTIIIMMHSFPHCDGDAQTIQADPNTSNTISALVPFSFHKTPGDSLSPIQTGRGGGGGRAGGREGEREGGGGDREGEGGRQKQRDRETETEIKARQSRISSADAPASIQPLILSFHTIFINVILGDSPGLGPRTASCQQRHRASSRPSGPGNRQYLDAPLASFSGKPARYEIAPTPPGSRGSE